MVCGSLKYTTSIVQGWMEEYTRAQNRNKPGTCEAKCGKPFRRIYFLKKKKCIGTLHWAKFSSFVYSNFRVTACDTSNVVAKSNSQHSLQYVQVDASSSSFKQRWLRQKSHPSSGPKKTRIKRPKNAGIKVVANTCKSAANLSHSAFIPKNTLSLRCPPLQILK